MTVSVAENRDVLVGFLRQKLAQIAEIPVTCQQSQVRKLVLIGVLHCLHDNGDVDFCLNLQVEARLAHETLLVRAEDLLALESSDVQSEAQRAHLLVKMLPVLNGGLAPLGRHVVHEVVLAPGKLAHVLEHDRHRGRVHE